jgi:glycosyltransferase involved in cell wall biosynthesis
VEEGKNGFLVPPRDGRALAQRIAEMHADAALCARFGRRSSEIVRERFDDRIVGRQVLAEMGVGG